MPQPHPSLTVVATTTTSAATTLLDNLPAPLRYLLYLTSTLLIGGGGVYYLWHRLFRHTHSPNHNAERRRGRRNTVDLRKPPQLWNTAIFFPDFRTKDPNSKTAQLLYYFGAAKISIQICIYNSSLKDLEDLLYEKFKEGLLVEVVTGSQHTFHTFQQYGIKVGLHAVSTGGSSSDHLMHHKFAIFDSEAVMTGSLNWTLDGITGNRENVVISTDQRHVKKYLAEFYKLMKACEDNNSVSYSTTPS